MTINLPPKIFSDHGLSKYYLQKDTAINPNIQIKDNNYFNVINTGSVDTRSTIGRIIALFQVALLSFECAFIYGMFNSNIETAEKNINWANGIKKSNEPNIIYKKVFDLYTDGEIRVVENNKLYKRSFEAFIASVALVAFGTLFGSGVLTTLGLVSGLAASVFGGYHFACHCTDYSNITEQLKEMIDQNRTNITLQAA